MGVAAGATRFGAGHAVAAVGVFADVLAVGGGVETRPSGARIEFRFRAKKQRATADAVIRPVIVFVPVLAGEGGFGATLAGNLVLLGRQLLLPLLVGLLDLVGELLSHSVSKNEM